MSFLFSTEIFFSFYLQVFFFIFQFFIVFFFQLETFNLKSVFFARKKGQYIAQCGIITVSGRHLSTKYTFMICSRCVFVALRKMCVFFDVDDQVRHIGRVSGAICVQTFSATGTMEFAVKAL